MNYLFESKLTISFYPSSSQNITCIKFIEHRREKKLEMFIIGSEKNELLKR